MMLLRDTNLENDQVVIRTNVRLNNRWATCIWSYWFQKHNEISLHQYPIFMLNFKKQLQQLANWNCSINQHIAEYCFLDFNRLEIICNCIFIQRNLKRSLPTVLLCGCFSNISSNFTFAQLVTLVIIFIGDFKSLSPTFCR